MRKSTLNIEWPKSFFTIQDIQNEHPGAKNITIRFRINKALEENKIAYIGKNPSKVGRPTIVFSSVPVNEDVLSEAVNAGVILDESFEDKVVVVAKVYKSETETQPTETEELEKLNLISN
jgi:hypothetical protein